MERGKDIEMLSFKKKTKKEDAEMLEMVLKGTHIWKKNTACHKKFPYLCNVKI